MLLQVRYILADILSHRKKLAVPLPPARLRYRISESLSVKTFLDVGKVCAELIEQTLSIVGSEIVTANRVLDFGCGCGRTVRWFLDRNISTEFHGVDVDEESIAWCSANLYKGRFEVSHVDPPLSYPSEYFDVVYCISVFTHLNEAMQDRWLAELARVLKPDGVIVFTIHGKAFEGSLDGEQLNQLQNNGMLHLRSEKLGGLVPEWYNTSWHTRAYIVRRARIWFRDVNYYKVADGLQDFVVGRKGLGAGS